MRLIGLLVLALLALAATPAQAAASPDYISAGFGGYNFDKSDSRRSVDYRLEYQWGLSLLPRIADSFNSVEPFLQVHPTVGFEGNTRGSIYSHGGFNLDIPFLRHGVFTWGEEVGLFDRGNDARGLGSVLQFRSQLELGWKFNNDLRLSGFISHMSNAGIFADNPGAEILGIYVRVPTSLLGLK